MRLFLLASYILLCISVNYAEAQTTDKQADKQYLRSIQRLPSYPGGMKAFNKMITSNLKYPEIAELIGINGRIEVSFVIDTAGQLTYITPLNCIGAGCESEAVKALAMSKTWLPGMQDNKLVRVQYKVPIAFSINKSKVSFKELRKSRYGFIFEINGLEYTIDDAEKKWGKSFPSAQIEIATPYPSADKFPELADKEVYLLKMKTS